MSIKLENITKIYGAQKAVDEISFEIKSGEIVGFLGPNGAGKTTTMKILTCYIPPSSGKASVNGFDVVDQSLEVRRQVGYLPEHNPLYLDMFVKEYLSFMGELHGIKKNLKDSVQLMIEKTGLEREQKKKIGQLSKGYRQRVGLAQALIHDPKVLILDEPTSGLDPNQLVEIRNLILEIGKDKTVLFSTHIMQEVEALCNRVIIIDKGKIVADDKTGELQNKGVSDEYYRVSFSGTVRAEELKNIDGVKDIKELSEGKWLIKAQSGKKVSELLFKLAVNKNLIISELIKEEKSLEEVFRQFTKSSKN